MSRDKVDLRGDVETVTPDTILPTYTSEGSSGPEGLSFLTEGSNGNPKRLLITRQRKEEREEEEEEE